MRRFVEESPVAPSGARPPAGTAAAAAAPRACPARSRSGLAVAAAALLVLASCASVPQREPSEWLGALPTDATLYASLSVTGSKDLLKKILADAGKDFKDVASLTDMTNRLVCSVTLVKGSPVRLSVVALGNYPSGIIGMRLGGNKEWSKASTPDGGYWQWSKAGIQVSLPNNAILLASNGGIGELLAGWRTPSVVAMPPDVAYDMKTADLVLYMPVLPGGLAENADSKGVHLPIQEVWLNAVKAQAGYDISGTANTGSEREAKILTLALKLGIVAWMRTQNIPNVAERLKTITVTPNGLQVKLAGLHLSDDEIIPLFLSLMKGFSPAEPAAQQAVPESVSGEAAEVPTPGGAAGQPGAAVPDAAAEAAEPAE
jgi:hypothetical protein